MTASPLAPGTHTVTLNGTTLRYRVVGRGPVLVVQPPGWGIGAAPYESTFLPLEDSFTLVHLQPRGSSGRPAEPTSKLHVGTFIEDLEALRTHLGLETMALTGHSHGGFIAMHYALRYPDRVRALLLLAAQLVGVGSHRGERDGQMDPRRVPEIAEGYAYLERVGGFHRMFTATTDDEATGFLRGIAPLYFKDPRHAAALRAMLDVATVPVHTMQTVSGMDGAFPLDARALRACAVPTLAVSGRYDLFCPPSVSRQLVSLLPAGRQVVFEESGHFPWLEEPDACFAAIRHFLADPTLIPAR